MIGRRQLALVILVVGVAVLCLQLFRRGAGTPGVRAHETVAAPTTTLEQRIVPPLNQVPAGSTQSESEEAVASTPAPAQPRINPPAAAPAEPVPETPESASLPAPTVLENMRTTLRQYAAALGENPVGTNPEITSALTGENPKQINFLKPDGNRVIPRVSWWTPGELPISSISFPRTKWKSVQPDLIGSCTPRMISSPAKRVRTDAHVGGPGTTGPRDVLGQQHVRSHARV
jgi:hypothetical protein